MSTTVSTETDDRSPGPTRPGHPSASRRIGAVNNGDWCWPQLGKKQPVLRDSVGILSQYTAKTTRLCILLHIKYGWTDTNYHYFFKNILNRVALSHRCCMACLYSA